MHTNARLMDVGEIVALIGFGNKYGVNLDSAEGSDFIMTPSITDTNMLKTSLSGSLIQQNAGKHYAGSLALGGAYLSMASSRRTILHVHGIVVPGNTNNPSPGGGGLGGMVLDDSGVHFYAKDTLTFDASGSLLTPLASASVRLAINNDSSSLSVYVGREDLQEVLFVSRSKNIPRIGVGTSDPKTSFDIKEIEDTSTGAEILIRSARTAIKGGQAGDSAGKIIFAFDSASYSDIKTSGSIAIITTEATDVTAEKASGDLILKTSDGTTYAPIETLRLNTTTSILTSSLNVKGINLQLSHSVHTALHTVITSDARTTVSTLSTQIYAGAIFDYILTGTAGGRIGQFMVLSGSGGVTFTDTSAPAIGGDTVEPIISASAANKLLTVSVLNGAGYTFKTVRKAL